MSPAPPWQTKSPYPTPPSTPNPPDPDPNPTISTHLPQDKEAASLSQQLTSIDPQLQLALRGLLSHVVEVVPTLLDGARLHAADQAAQASRAREAAAAAARREVMGLVYQGIGGPAPPERRAQVDPGRDECWGTEGVEERKGDDSEACMVFKHGGDMSDAADDFQQPLLEFCKAQGLDVEGVGAAVERLLRHTPLPLARAVLQAVEGVLKTGEDANVVSGGHIRHATPVLHDLHCLLVAMPVPLTVYELL